MLAKKPALKRFRVALFVLLSSGALFSTCSGRLKDAAVEGTTSFLFSLLNPTEIAGLFTATGALSNVI